MTQSWLQKIDSALLDLEERPQFGVPDSYPIEPLQGFLSRLFKKPELKLSFLEKGWMPPKELLKGLGGKLLPLTIQMTPLEPSFYFLVSEQDLKELMADVIGGDARFAPFYDRNLVDGFYYYLALEILQFTENSGFAHSLSPRLAEESGELKALLATEQCYVIDATCDLGNKTIWGRLLIPNLFRQAWKKHFKLNRQAMHLDANLSVELSFEIGRSHLTVDEFKTARVGDLILLDMCSFQPTERKGGMTVMLGLHPIFRGKWKNNQVELLEFPFEELGETMVDDDIQEEAAEDRGVVDVGKLEVNLSVEIARVRMTLRDLSELAPGSVVQLQESKQLLVTLLANGKRIGQGELVEIGEAVGVRITSF